MIAHRRVHLVGDRLTLILLKSSKELNYVKGYVDTSSYVRIRLHKTFFLRIYDIIRGYCQHECIVVTNCHILDSKISEFIELENK